MECGEVNKEINRDIKIALLNDFVKEVDNWATSVDEVVQLLNKYHVKKQPWGMQIMQTEMAFAKAMGENKQKKNDSKGRSINPNIICHRCGEDRHIA